MPEGPELALSRDFLRFNIRGKSIEKMNFFSSGRYRSKKPKGYDHFSSIVEKSNLPLTVDEVETKGKFMWWSLQGDRFCRINVAITYGMSGQFRTLPSKHTAYSFDFVDNSSIFFEDIRHFGTIQFMDDVTLESKLASLGPDMLQSPPSLDRFILRLKKYGHKTLPEVLMNQKVISGVGNYIKSEALYRAMISPHRTVDSLSHGDFSLLFRAIQSVMETAYQSGGATIQSFSNPDGKEGYATKNFLVYRHTKSQDKGYTVKSEQTKDKRTTWWCPQVQI